jgi:hypothetical protein
VKEVYLGLLEGGWTLNDCDEMDFLYYLDLMLYRIEKAEEPECTIDEVF